MNSKLKNIFFIIITALITIIFLLGFKNESYASTNTGKSGLLNAEVPLKYNVNSIGSYLPQEVIVRNKKIYVYCIQKGGEINIQYGKPTFIVKREIDLTDTKNKDNSQTYAYIFAETEAETANESEKERLRQIAQVAIWIDCSREEDSLNEAQNSYNRNMYNNKIPGVTIKRIERLLNEAKAFQEYYNELQKLDGDVIKDKTDYNKINVLYDYSSKEYLVGPFKMKYVSKVIGQKQFAYIKNMVVKQYLPDGKVVETDKIEFLIKDKKKEKSYPASGEEFYVKYKGEDSVYGMSLEGKFHYVVGYKGFLLEIEGTRPTPGGKRRKQQLLLASAGYPEKEVADKDFELKPDSGYIPVTMKLAGYVWIDKESGKQTISDGLINNDYELNLSTGVKSKDAIIPPGVIVTLYKNGEKEPARLVQGNKTFPNPVTIDDNGYYEFNGLSSGDGDKYYVTFKYDGITYQDTIFMANQTGEKDKAYKEYGTSDWLRNSKGMEDQKVREKFNQGFSNIGSYPENYISKTTGKPNMVFINNDYNDDKIDDNKPDLSDVRNNAWNKMKEVTKNKTNLTQDKIDNIYKEVTKNVENGNEMHTFINDTYMELRTKHDYPYIDRYYIGNKDKKVGGVTYKALYDGQLRVNQGLWVRPKADLGLIKDVAFTEVSINGKNYRYNANKLEKIIENNNEIWKMTVRNSDVEFNSVKYDTNLYKSDYDFKHDSDIYKEIHSEDDELEVFVTYKILIRNCSSTIDMKVNEFVDYYDKEYSFLKAYYYEDGKEKSLNASEKSIYSENTQFKNQANKDNLNTIYIKDKNETNKDFYIRPDNQRVIYLKFKVNKDNNRNVILDEKDVAETAKHNVIEINGYSTRYSNGTKVPRGQSYVDITKDSNNNFMEVPAGILDCNSIPGNLREDFKNKKKYENDTSMSPMMYVIVPDGNERKVNGVVWDDNRTVEKGNAVVGDGSYNDGEKLVSGVTVNLIEFKNGKEKVVKKIETSETGYEMVGFIPGDYYIKFTYGDNLVSKNKDGYTYNGHDYKSTSYQVGVNNGFKKDHKIDEDYINPTLANIKDHQYLIEESEKVRVSDAKDIWARRQTVNGYSNEGIMNELATNLSKLANGNNPPQETIDATVMYAVTGYIDAGVEKQENSSSGSGYILSGIDLGLEERPKAQLALDKKVVKIKLTLANGNVLFETDKTAKNLMWVNGIDHETGYTGKLMKRPTVSGTMTTGKDFIQMVLDIEMMHGSKLEATYEIKVRNVGEVDYQDISFYYTGDVLKEDSIVKTSAEQIIEYVNSNLNFNLNNNDSDWDIKTGEQVLNDKLIDTEITSVKNYETVLLTQAMKNELIPHIANKGNNTLTKNLLLTQVITSSNKPEDLIYDNVIEIIKTKNTVGRRMAYSIEGNQDPKEAIAEVDADKAETIRIVPPYGEQRVYYTMGISIMLIIIAGVILIKKYVLPKK